MNNDMFEVTVTKKIPEAEGIYAYELTASDGRSLQPFSAGSHIDVEVKPGLIRQYSLCNAPDETHRYQIAVLRDPSSRGGSIAMHDEVNEGDTIRISQPRNHFELANGAHQNVLMAGGIGVTPILCMAERLSSAGLPFRMHYCARSAQSAAFVQRVKTAGFSQQVSFYFDDQPEAEKLDIRATLDKAEPDAHVYVCGPKGFIDAVVSAAEGLGWSAGRIHYEHFGAAVDLKEGDAFDIKIASSGKVVHVPIGTSALEALQAQGIDVPFSCEQGVCGSCLTRVLEGEPDHKDLFLSEKERKANDQFLPCCSRSKTKILVLDL